MNLKNSEKSEKNKIKVLHLGHYSHSLISNAYEDDIYDRDWNVRFAKELKKYHPEIEVEVWNIERKYDKENVKFVKGIKFRTFTSSFALRYGKEISLPYYKALRKEAIECKNNNIKLIIHVHEPHNWHGIIIPLFFKDQILFAQHHGGRSPMKHLLRKVIYYPLFPLLFIEQIFENISIKNYEKIYYLTESEKYYLQKKMDKNKIEFRTMGVDFDKFKPLNKYFTRKKLGINKEDKIILFVGSVIERKGAIYLILALKKVIERMPNAKLLIIGETEKEKKYYEKLVKIVKKESLGNNVEFLGRIESSRIPLYLNSSDVYVLPSLDEGAPVSLMEPLACNIPVIGTNVGSVSEIIKDNRGILIKPKNSEDIANSILHVFKNKNKFNNIRSKSMAFDWKNIINETVKDYKHIKK